MTKSDKKINMSKEQLLIFVRTALAYIKKYLMHFNHNIVKAIHQLYASMLLYQK